MVETKNSNKNWINKEIKLGEVPKKFNGSTIKAKCTQNYKNFEI